MLTGEQCSALATYGGLDRALRAEELDWFADMSQDDVDHNRQLLTGPEAARAKMDKDREGLLVASADDLAQAFGSLAAPADAAALQGEVWGDVSGHA